MKILFWGVIIAYILVRGVMITLQYVGDASPEKSAHARRYFTGEEIKKSDAYHSEDACAAVIRAAVIFAVPLILLLTGLAQWFAGRCSDWSGGRAWLQVMIFASSLVILEYLITLPFSYYFSFVREQRFGLSNQTAVGWIIFSLKGCALNLVISTVIASFIFFVFKRYPNGWVWIIPLGMTLVSFLLSVVWPRLVLPIFYSVAPLERNEQTEHLYRTAESAGIDVEKVYIINESRYSSHTNAFVTGWGNMKSIYVYDTLLRENTPRESSVILAHEIGHWRRQHVLKYLLLGGLAALAGCLLLKWAYPAISAIEALNVGELRNVSCLPLLTLLMTVSLYFLSPVGSWVSRTFEEQADEESLVITQDREAYRGAFIKLARANKSYLFPHPAAVIWSHTHPPILERLRKGEDAPATH